VVGPAHPGPFPAVVGRAGLLRAVEDAAGPGDGVLEPPRAIGVPERALLVIPVDQGEAFRYPALDPGEQVGVEGRLEDVALLDAGRQLDLDDLVGIIAEGRPHAFPLDQDVGTALQVLGQIQHRETADRRFPPGHRVQEACEALPGIRKGNRGAAGPAGRKDAPLVLHPALEEKLPVRAQGIAALGGAELVAPDGVGRAVIQGDRAGRDLPRQTPCRAGLQQHAGNRHATHHSGATRICQSRGGAAPGMS